MSDGNQILVLSVSNWHGDPITGLTATAVDGGFDYQVQVHAVSCRDEEIESLRAQLEAAPAQSTLDKMDEAYAQLQEENARLRLNVQDARRQYLELLDETRATLQTEPGENEKKKPPVCPTCLGPAGTMTVGTCPVCNRSATTEEESE